MLSNTSKYAVRAVIYLAFNEIQGKKTGIKQISSDLDIPTPFLGKILQNLARHKILASTKGPNGGFGLGKPAADISLMDIVEVIDGLDDFNRCLIGRHSCKNGEAPCPVHDEYAHIREQFKSMFEKQTVGLIVEKMKTSNQAFNW